MSRRSKITRCSGAARLSITIATGATSNVLLVAPSQFARASNLQKGFEFYRFTKLELTVPPQLRILPNGTLVDSSQLFALGYYPEVTTATTTTINDASVLGLEASLMSQANLQVAVGGTNIGVSGCTVARKLSVPKRVLMNTPAKWYRTNATASSEDLEVTQGTLIAAVTTSDATNTFGVRFHAKYTIEFCGEVDSTALTLSSTNRPGAFSDVPDPSGMVLVNEATTGAVWVDRDDFKKWIEAPKPAFPSLKK